MNNLPINLNAAPVNTKPSVSANGLSAKATATPNSAAANNVPAKPFGEVLARHVADAEPANAEPANADSPVTETVEKEATKKTVKAKTADEIFEQLNDNRGAADMPPEVPAALLASLIPAAATANTVLSTAEAAEFESGATAGQSASDALGLAQKKTRLSVTGEGRDGAVTPSASPRANAEPVDFKKETVLAGMLATKQEIESNTLNNKDNIVQSSPVTTSPVLANAASLLPANLMPAQLRIDTPLTQRNWGDEFGQKITWIASSKEQSAELHLNPPQLGPMDVVLKVSGDQATALFTSPHAAVREAIEQAMPRLREMLADSGIMLGNATVSDQSSHQTQDGRGDGAATRRDTRAEGDLTALNMRARVSPIRQHNGIVDTFA